MLKTVLTLLAGTVICVNIMAETATQTDWSGGPGISGPVMDWGNMFDMEVGINWYRAAGKLSLEYIPPIENPVHETYTRANHAIPADFDGDGDMDVLGASGRYSPPYFYTGRVDWWENLDSTGTSWTRHTIDDDFESAPSVYPVDVDGDGDCDVIGTARGYINDLVWWENADSLGITWIEHTIPTSLQEGSSIYAADMDGDEYMDIICTDVSYGDVIWLENADGTGTNWIEHTIDGGFGGAEAVYAIDMDDDEDMDVVGAAFEHDDITWWENMDGVGINWTEHAVDGNFDGARSVYAADMDGDGDMDVQGASWNDWEIAWWENLDGAGINWDRHLVSGSFNYAFAVHAADIDGDDDADILGAAYFGDDITWWENTDGSGANLVEHTVDDNFDGARDVCTGDMDGDGDLDILGAAHEAGDISWWDVTCCTPSGELVSSIFDTDTLAQWDSLTWISETPYETSLSFQVRSSLDPIEMGEWSDDIEVPGNLSAYLTDGDRYVQYKVYLETPNPANSPVLEEVTITWTGMLDVGNLVGVEQPSEFCLYPNFPNPFNAATVIKYSLPQAGPVMLTIHNILGQKVATIFDESQQTGHQKVSWGANSFPSGIYFAQLKSGSEIKTIKMVLLK